MLLIFFIIVIIRLLYLSHIKWRDSNKILAFSIYILYWINSEKKVLILYHNFSINGIFDFTIRHSEKFQLVNYLLKIIERKFRNTIFFRDFVKNLENELDHLNFNIKYQTKKFPGRAQVEINNTCNLNCLMCNTKASKRPPGNMEFQLFDSILEKLGQIGIKNVALHTVGEPFMYKNLDRLFQIINKYDFKVNLSTNGQFPKKIHDLLNSHYKSINLIRFSIDGATKETYEEIRRGATFTRLIESLEVVREFNQNKINYKIPVKINSTLSMTNIHEIVQFLRIYTKYCWIELIEFNIVNGLSPDNKYFRKVFPFSNLIKKRVPCSLVFNNIYFTYDGMVSLCCRDYNGDVIVGDLKNNTLIEIWNNDKSESIRKQHLNQEKLTIDACKECYYTFPFVSMIINKYIHFLYHYYPNLSEQQFSEKVIALLKEMDNIMKNKDKNLIKQTVLKHFTKKNNL